MTLFATLNETLALSHQILLAAEQQNVDAIHALELKRRELLSNHPEPWPAMSLVEAENLRQLIEEILALDTRTQNFLLPWRDQMRTLLGRLPPNSP